MHFMKFKMKNSKNQRLNWIFANAWPLLCTNLINEVYVLTVAVCFNWFQLNFIVFGDFWFFPPLYWCSFDHLYRYGCGTKRSFIWWRIFNFWFSISASAQFRFLFAFAHICVFQSSNCTLILLFIFCMGFLHSFISKKDASIHSNLFDALYKHDFLFKYSRVFRFFFGWIRVYIFHPESIQTKKKSFFLPGVQQNAQQITSSGAEQQNAKRYSKREKYTKNGYFFNERRLKRLFRSAV